jgi:Subtilase family
MPNNPVQIVLNDNAFLRAPDPGRGGPDKDFFVGDDEGFVHPRDALLAAVDAIDAALRTSQYGPLAYVRVRMRNEAIAKSYRPNRAIFLPDQFPCVGAGAPGELYFRAPRHYLQRLRSRIAAAEDHGETRRSRRTGAPYLFVTRTRSEVGAIETIEITPPELKRKFAASDAVIALLDASAASGYVVELFEQSPLLAAGDDDVLGLHRSFETLQTRLGELGPGLYAALLPSPGGVPSIELLLTTSPAPPLIEDRRLVRADLAADDPAPAPVDSNVARHEIALTGLAEHPLVRRIRFPVMIQATEGASNARSGRFPAPNRVANAIYPKVGVIDTGVASVLAQWVVHRHDFLDTTDADPNHGTLVAGVLLAARAANGPEIGREADGCDLVDIPLMPRRRFLDVYGPRGFEAFLEELEAAIAEARENHGIRVFNMSLNIRSPVEQDLYSVYAARLDEIQDRHSVVIVNSAGNLDGPDWRSPWPARPGQALAALATRTTPDTVYMPCESVRAMAVGALNPPGCAHLAGAPTTYTRRGPGLRVGMKPDLAHYGGAGDAKTLTVTALASCDASGALIETRGTSFAAPLVAKTLAVLDVATGQRLEPRTLRAFLVHNAVVPECLTPSRLRDVARQFVGFGQPDTAIKMLDRRPRHHPSVRESTDRRRTAPGDLALPLRLAGVAGGPRHTSLPRPGADDPGL